MMNEYLNQRNVFPKLKETTNSKKQENLGGSIYVIKKDAKHKTTLAQVERGPKLGMTKGVGSEERCSSPSSDSRSEEEIA